MTQLTDEEIDAAMPWAEHVDLIESYSVEQVRAAVRAGIARHEEKMRAECEPTAEIDTRHGDLRCMKWHVPLQSLPHGTKLYARSQQDARDAERLGWVLSRVIIDELGVALPAGNSRTQPAWAQQKAKNIAAIDVAIAAQKGGA